LASRSGTVYKQIAELLVSEIQTGLWKVGDQMPAEQELMERFKASRNTVREALRTLKDQGYIKRKQGARSVVSGTSAANPFVNMVSAVDDINIYLRDTNSLVLGSDLVLVSEKTAEDTRVKPGSRQLRIMLLRSRKDNGEPLCYTEAYVPPRYKDIVNKLGNGPAVYERIEAEYGISITHINQEIEAQRADANVASRLQVEVGSPVLVVRTYFHTADDEVVEVSISSYPQQRYRLRIRLNRREMGHL